MQGIEEYVEYYSKEMNRIKIIQKFILNNDELKGYDTELLSRLIFPIIEELGFCLLGGNGLKVDKKGKIIPYINTTKCIEEILKEILDINDIIAQKIIPKCFRHSLLHQSHASFDFSYENKTYLIGYSVSLPASNREIIKKSSDNVYHFYINNLVYHLNNPSLKKKISDTLENNQSNFLFAVDYKQSDLFSFYKKGLKNGDKIVFIADKKISAKVCGKRKVKYKGQVWKLSPLTYKIFEEKGELNSSGAYQGANYFEYKGTKLKDLPDIN